MSWSRTALFFEQLRVLLHAGIPLSESVDQACAHAGGLYAQHAAHWTQHIMRGQPLSDAMAATATNQLSGMVIALVRAGEKSGRLPDMAQEIARYYRHFITLRQGIISRLIYPVLLLHGVLLTGSIILIFMFQWSAWILLCAPLCLWLSVACLYGVWRALSPRFTAACALRAPFASVTMPLFAAQICMMVKAALSAGMLIPDALALSADACSNLLLRERLHAMARGVRHGQVENLTSAFAQVGLPTLVVDLCRSGEKSGQLDTTLQQANSAMSAAFALRSEWAARIFTGTIYALAMGAVIVVVISFYLGYIGLLNSVMEDM
jgi:general secretion pathway protein F